MLKHGKSAKAFSHNVATEMHAGKPLKQSLAIAYSLKRKAAHKKAMGGLMEHEHEELASGYLPEPEEHEIHNLAAEHETEKELKETQHKAHGGMMHKMGGHHDSTHGYPGHHAHGGDIVDEVLAKHKMKHYSEGGRLANDTEIEAGFKPNQFDDLVLRDDLEDHHNTGADDGDFIGDEREDHDRHDIVEHIMNSVKKKKERMPYPA